MGGVGQPEAARLVTGLRQRRSRVRMTLAEARRLGQRLSGYQLFWMALSVRLVTVVALLPTLTGSRAGRDAWIAFLAATVPAAALGWAIGYPSARFPGRGLVGQARASFGLWPGTVVALVYLAGYLITTATILREYTDAIVTAILPTTPPVVVVSIITVLAGVAASQETAAMGRLAVLLGGVVVFSVVIIGGLISPEIRLDNLMPVGSTGWRGFLSGLLMVLVWHSQYVFFYPLADTMAEPGAGPKALALAAAVSSVLGSAIAAVAVGVLTAELAVNASFPLFEVARLVSVGEFVQRIDAVAVGAWGLGLVLSASLFYHAAARGMAELLGLPQHRLVVKPMGVILVVVAMAVAEDSIEMRRFTDVKVLAPIAAAFVWLLASVWAAAAWLRGGATAAAQKGPG
ncbi:MAG TPA: GerAB/ArcD/ProY family transporter [Limnochordales bacterium]